VVVLAGSERQHWLDAHFHVSEDPSVLQNVKVLHKFLTPWLMYLESEELKQNRRRHLIPKHGRLSKLCENILWTPSDCRLVVWSTQIV
jgi:hypothetical protein